MQKALKTVRELQQWKDIKVCQLFPWNLPIFGDMKMILVNIIYFYVAYYVRKFTPKYYKKYTFDTSYLLRPFCVNMIKVYCETNEACCLYLVL